MINQPLNKINNQQIHFFKVLQHFLPNLKRFFFFQWLNFAENLNLIFVQFIFKNAATFSAQLKRFFSSNGSIMQRIWI